MNSCVPTTTEIKLYINDSYNYYISKNDKIQNDNYKNNENGSDIQYT